MAEGVSWKEWIDGPMGYALRGATYGGALGWLYDKMRDKKNKGSNTLKRIATGALLGSLSGSALHNYRSISKDDTRSMVQEILERLKAAGNPNVSPGSDGRDGKK